MDIQELLDSIDSILDPEPEPDMEPREIPHARLEQHHGLDLSYLASLTCEGSTVHPHTRLCSPTDTALHTLTGNADVSRRLLEAGLRLFGDSISTYHGSEERKGQLRFYPPIILTFWSGFETFVRYSSELMLITVPTIPECVANHLRDIEVFVDPNGAPKTRAKYHSVLDRYAALLRHGYGVTVDRGARWWQDLEAAKAARDYYTHLDVTEPRAVSSEDVLRFMETVLLAVIYPSAKCSRTLLLGAYDLYWQWADLSELAEPYVEQPFFKDWPRHEGYMFHCNFDNVDAARFPSCHDEEHWQTALRRSRGAEEGTSDTR